MTITPREQLAERVRTQQWLNNRISRDIEARDRLNAEIAELEDKGARLTHPGLDPIDEQRPPTSEELERMILTLRSNGYDVAKQANHGEEYVSSIFEFALNDEATQYVTRLASQGAHHLNEVLVEAATRAGRNQLKDVEVYVEIDRALLIDEINRVLNEGTVAAVQGGELWSHLWPVVARIDDENDVILHLTSGERAQFGRGERG